MDTSRQTKKRQIIKRAISKGEGFNMGGEWTTIRLDLESLQVLVSVIEEGSLAAASERQHIVPSTIGRRIAELESDTSTAPLYRYSRGVESTLAGSVLYYRAKCLIDQIQEISSEMSEYA